MKFTVQIGILTGIVTGRRIPGVLTFSAPSIHHARKIVGNGVMFFGADAPKKVKPVR